MTFARYQRTEKIISTHMDGDTVMMDVDSGKYYAIGGVGNLIWSALETPQDLNSLHMRVCDAYDVSESQARADVEAFVQSLLEARLVRKV